MHVPDGFFNAGASIGAGVAAAGGIGAALKQTGRQLADKRIPLAGITAALIFALQMLNFPVLPGVSGHLMGGALAAILLGPWLGILVTTVVVVVQAVIFADGGISALGINVINMAIITALVGWFVFRFLTRVLPKTTGSVLISTMVAGFVSVLASSWGFVLEYMIGGTFEVPLGTLIGGMTGVHALIGIGEGLISAAIIGAVVAIRRDLVYGIEDYEMAKTLTAPSKASVGALVAGGLAVALALVLFVAPIANPNPDGLESVAADTGFEETATDHPIGGPLADYQVSGVESERWGTVIAGVVGVAVALGIGFVIARVRSKQPQSTSAS
ncbi:MAG: cobalt ABC transporter permease [Acidimicrobiia bacterium]|nr:cobalt ABC transporter permease [Acidimicrobiia bacterium]